MISRRHFDPTNLLLAIIIILAFILRLWNISSLSFTNDELSAIYRLRFGSLQQIIDHGIRVDGHPAGVQVFLYFWTRLVGYSEMAVRLPFVILNVSTCFLIFQVGKKWFSAQTGLLAAAAFAFLLYPLTYGQLARPYAIGSFFTLAAAFFWTKLLFENHSKRNNIFTLLGLAFSFAACLFTHYFAGFTAIIIGASGLFFLRPQKIFYYLGAALITILLFLPHIAISLGHLKLGGVGNWLGKPGGDWIFTYLFNSFNASWWVVGILLCMLLLQTLNNRQVRFKRFHLLSLLWFVLLFLTGFFYSIFINPVLQDSVLLFAFPFLLLFVFSGVEKIKVPVSILVLIISLTFLSSTLIEKKAYSTYRFADFKGIGKRLNSWVDKHNKDSLMILAAINEPHYLTFYLKDTTAINSRVHGFLNHPSELLPDLLQQKTPFLAYARLKMASPHSTAFLQVLFPTMIEQHLQGNHSSVVLLSKKDQKPLFEEDVIFDKKEGLNLHNSEFSPAIEPDLKTLIKLHPQRLQFEVQFNCPQKAEKTYIVLHLTFDSGEEEIYESMELSLFQTGSFANKAFVAVSLPGELPETAHIKAYLWNPERKEIYIHSQKLSYYK